MSRSASERLGPATRLCRLRYLSGALSADSPLAAKARCKADQRYLLFVICVRLRARRINAPECLPCRNAHCEIGFDVVLFLADIRELLGQMRRHDRQAVSISNDHVARINRHARTTDRHLQIRDIVKRNACRRRDFPSICWQRHLRDHGAVTQRAVRDDGSHAACQQTCDDDIAHRHRARIITTVNH
jgi:hypothetical protein